MATYKEDLQFLRAHGIDTIEIGSGCSKVLISPSLQGRVMTSTTGSISYGWINRRFIHEGKISDQFNPIGGEERFWIGPEGGPNSFYFAPGAEQIYSNWRVPPVIDTIAFRAESIEPDKAVFCQEAQLINARGNNFSIGIRRTVRMLNPETLGLNVPGNIKPLAYSTENTITNLGDSAWTKEYGLPSIWLLGSFNPTPSTTVYIPYNENFPGRKINDEYFGKIPSERLKNENGVFRFKIDGQYRSKIGLPKGSSRNICGSYDSIHKILNIIRCNAPDQESVYVNSQWGLQEDPFCGDVINSYNDGPTDTGYVMGPFYEIETSSPGAELAPGESLTHTQQTMHFEGQEEDLKALASLLLGVEI